MRSITLVFDQKPIPKQSARFVPKKNGTGITSHQTDVIKLYERHILIEAIQQVGGGFKPLTGALSVDVEYMYKYPQSMKSAQRKFIESGGKIRKITMPDLTDNLNKGLFDALQGRFYKNDSDIEKISYKESKNKYAPYSKKVRLTKNGIDKDFDSILEASKYLNRNTSNLSTLLKGRGKTINGHTAKFI